MAFKSTWRGHTPLNILLRWLKEGNPNQSPRNVDQKEIVKEKKVDRSRRTNSNFKQVKSGRVVKKWQGKEAAKSHGLFNKENFCYRISLLQCLIHLPEFNDYLEGVHNDCQQDNKECVVCALKGLFETYWTGPRSRKPIQDLNMAMKSNLPQDPLLSDDFENEEQSDPYDFLRYLLKDQLEPIQKRGDDFTIDDVFGIEHTASWTCEECDNTTEKKETANECSTRGFGITVSIQKPWKQLPLMNYLRHNVYREKLSIRCDSSDCVKNFEDEDDRTTERLRSRFITKAPEVLVIQLDRFFMDEKLEPIKLFDDVTFEEYLNLGEFTESQDNLFYKLQGVVSHRGESVHAGHYIASIRQQDDTKFCSIDDDKALRFERQGTVFELELPQSHNVAFEPYLLIYSKL